MYLALMLQINVLWWLECCNTDHKLVVPEDLPPQAYFIFSGHGSSCPKIIGREPTSLPRLGDTQANLMLNNRFICDGFVRHFTYFRGNPDGSAYVGIWRQIGDMEFILRYRIELPPASIGIHTVHLSPPIAVARGDFLGVHYSADTKVGIVASSIPEDGVLDENELFQTLCVDIKNENMMLNTPLDLGGYRHDLLRKTFALSGTLNYDFDEVTAFPMPPVTSPGKHCTVRLVSSLIVLYVRNQICVIFLPMSSSVLFLLRSLLYFVTYVNFMLRSCLFCS